MVYNLHPIFVHFPIALLCLYSFIKILPLHIWFPRIAWRDIERALLLSGVLGAFAALTTGETAEHIVRPDRELVTAHSNFATASTWLYGALLIGEIAAYIRTRSFIRKYPPISKVFHFTERILCNRILSTCIALAALIALSLTGLLGGVMVYGLEADPFSSIVLDVLGITYP